MTNFIIRRLIISVFILFFLSIAVFVLLRVTPGNSELLQAGGGFVEAEKLEALKKEKGLDKPYFPITLMGGCAVGPICWPEPPFVEFNSDNQYWDWASDAARLEGKSAFNGVPIKEAIWTRMPTTIELLILTMAMTIIIGVPAGIVSALYRNSPIDLSVRFAAILGLSVPSFWLATLVLLVPLAIWSYAPPSLGVTIDFWDDPWNNLRQFVPPALILALASAAGIMRLTRSSLLEVLQADYVRTARAKGLRESLVVYRHALKNVLIPVVTVLGLQFTGLLGGTLFIELIFSLTGLGNYLFVAIFTKDYDVVQAMTLYVGVVVVLTQLAIDVTYAWIDPRIRYS